MRYVLISILICSSFLSSINAQISGAIASQTVQRSLQLAGTGSIGVAKPNDDPIGYYYNPAMLGYTSQSNHASFFFMPSKTKWGGDNTWWDITLSTTGFNIGYNLKDYNLPISIGIGYMHDKFSYGEYEGKETYDSFDNFSIGIGIDYYLLFNFGISYKPFKSEINYISTSLEHEFISVEGTSFDYGALIIAPITKLFLDDVIFYFSSNTRVKPLLNFSLGYSITNVGDEIYFIDPAQKDPLSRTARFGYTFDFGFDATINGTPINIFTYSFSAEAEDLLLEYEELPNDISLYGKALEFSGYQSLFGDIQIGNHLIQLKSDENVAVHKGHTFCIFETFTITLGSYSGKLYINNIKSNGYTFSTKGLSKLTSIITNNRTMNYIANHITVEFYDVNIFTGMESETNMQGISVKFENIRL